MNVHCYPVLLYTGERVFRAIRSGFYEGEILKASIYPGKVVSLNALKFLHWNGTLSLTLAPEDDYLSVHIRTAGDWSYQIYSLFQEATLSVLGYRRAYCFVSRLHEGNINLKPKAEMHNFLTCVHPEWDARSVLISTVQALHRAKTGIDFVSRTSVRTHFARPNWFSIFSTLACRHRQARIGVFYCGPSSPAEELEIM